MSILNFHKFLEEVNLTLPELGKTRGDSLRGNILVNKLKSGEPITTDKGDTIISKMKDDGRFIVNGSIFYSIGPSNYLQPFIGEVDGTIHLAGAAVNADFFKK